MKRYLTYGIIGAVCLLIGRYVLQPKQEVKTVEIIKYVEKKEEQKKSNKKTKIVENKRPDGSSTTETTIIEDHASSTTTETSSTKETSKIVSSKKGVSLGVLAIKDFPRFREKLDYGIVASVPLIGNLSVLTMADTTKRVGLGISLEF